MAEELQSLDVKLGILDKVGTREKMIYMGSAFFMLLLLDFIIRKSS
jgi:hypothetical protein